MIKLPDYLQNIPAPQANSIPFASAVPQLEASYSERDGFRCRANITDWTHGPWRSGGEIVWIAFEHCKSLEHSLALGKAWTDHAMMVIMSGGTVNTCNVVINMKDGEEGATVSTPNPKGYFMGEYVPQEPFYILGKRV